MQTNSDKKNCAGAAMPLVICVSAFLVAFSLALVYTAGLLLSRTNTKTDEERCYQLASSFAKQLEEALKETDAPAGAETSTETDASGETETSGANDFQTFANKFLADSAYNEYDAEHPESTVYHYLAETSEASDAYGAISVRLYKEVNENESTVLSGVLPISVEESNYTEAVKSCREKTFQNYILTIEVVAKIDNLSYTYKTEYTRMDQYAVRFTHDGNTIVWVEGDNSWHRDNEAGAVYNGWQSSSSAIQYQYLTDQLVSYSYQNVQAEKE